MGEAQVRAHLVLSAGGVKCVSYAGALSALSERNISFASVSACSAGSLVGALLCAGKTPQEIESFFYETKLSKLKGRWSRRPLSYVSWPYAWRRESGVPELFRRLVGELTFKQMLDRTGIPFALAGVDIASNRLLVYSPEEHPDMSVAEALSIANSVPFYQPPYEIPGRIVVDAVFASQCPVWLAAEYDEDVPIVALQPEKKRLFSHPRWPTQYIRQLLDAGVGSRDFYEVEQLTRVRMIHINCGDIRFDQTRLSRKQKGFLIQSGRDAVMEALEKKYGDDLSLPGRPAPKESGEGRESRAEAGATRLMRRFNRALPKLMRDHVFISYSHDDREWFERFRTHLGPYVRSGSVDLWDDTLIQGGDKWAEKINEALLRTKVALLLVTPEYLDSEFVNSTELPHFLTAAERKELTILWVPVKIASVEATKLASYQAARRGGMENALYALKDEPARDQAIKEICQVVLKAVGRKAGADPVFD